MKNIKFQIKKIKEKRFQTKTKVNLKVENFINRFIFNFIQFNIKETQKKRRKFLPRIKYIQNLFKYIYVSIFKYCTYL